MAGNVHDFTDEAFEALVLGNELPVLVDFWAPWCGPCKALTPAVEEIATEYDGKLVVGKMDIQSHPQAAGRLGIRSIPALIIFKEGQVAESLVGAVSKDKIKEKIDNVLS
jgi:thioredoxin 1